MYKILIIDDNIEDSQLIKNIVSENSKSIVVFNSDIEGIKKYIFNQNPDMIILDVAFNSGDGINILKMINSSKTPTLVVTAIDDITAKINCFKLGAVEYIIKPFDKKDFYYRVKNHLKYLQYSKSLSQYNAKLECVIENKNKELYETHFALIYTLASLVETRDNDAGPHLENISYFSKILAEELSYNPKYKYIITSEFIDNISLASALHDIGKICVRDAILLKPERLTPEEFEFIKLHTINGGRMLEQCKKNVSSYYLIDLAIEIAYYHHEKWDGSGYHLGLSGTDIPVGACIVALSDVYDAITSKRVYKDKMAHKEAIRYISSQKGKHFSPDVVDAFFKLEEKFKAKKFS
ncbi:MAG TPA: response regulator [bacterium]|nr:response regulator [bacterium]HPN30138.1 response regulator [bacterium]